MRRQVWRGVLLFLSLALVSTPVLAQVLYGSIVGTVTDTADLAVPGATVTITHAGVTVSPAPRRQALATNIITRNGTAGVSIRR